MGGTFYRPSFFGGFSFFPPVIKWLLISNTAIWILTDFLLVRVIVGGEPIGGDRGLITSLFALWPFGEHFWPWQLLTYMFLHGGFGHIFFNMLALWMFGMELENIWGSKSFLAYYLTCGLGAGITNLLVAPIIGLNVPTVGASGGVFGVLVAFGMLFPDRPIYIYFLLPIRAKFFVAGYIILELVHGVLGTSSGVAHFAHLGGAAIGFAFTMAMMRGFSFESLWRLFSMPHKKAEYRRARPLSRDEVFDAKFFDIKTGDRLDSENELDTEVMNSILEKIHDSGYQSLTEEEKRILNELSKKIN
ncbi:MAG: rhomboid family intramembrane serine protease [Ignavibacteriae bacterium]|nr:rhomboid family intramembrane serine protease [Ignavibacteriota bacterium]